MTRVGLNDEQGGAKPSHSWVYPEILPRGVIILKKMDEMEMYITLKSLRIAWVFTVICLIVWAVYDGIKTSQLGWPFILLVTQNIVFYTCQLIFKYRMAGKNEE